MDALRTFRTNFNTTPEAKGIGAHILETSSADRQKSTLATVMMTQFRDPRLENKFHRLLLMSADDKVKRTFALNRKITYLGRSRRNHVRIDDPSVSIKHLSISVSNDACIVTDLDSSNGTFINGEPLAGGQLLKDGDEIVMGKTVMRFARREASSVKRPETKPLSRVVPFMRKRAAPLTLALICLIASAAMAFFGAPYIVEHLKTRNQAAQSVQAPAVQDNTDPQPLQETQLQLALDAYAQGVLDEAIQHLQPLCAGEQQTPAALQANTILSKVASVKTLYVQAIEAQKQDQFTKAVDYWDQLLLLDMELIGDRPSFFAEEAGYRVQALSYKHAVQAFQSKNHRKAKQLCQFILQINPKHAEALALQAKIDKKA
jgi:hypothetical protein